MGWLKLWLPAIGWAGVISWASTDAFSATHTSGFILPILHWLFPHASAETLDWLHLCIRKAGHFAEYFVFSLFLLRALRGEHRGWQLRWAIAALAIAAGYSVLDEFHQSFVLSRAASPWDSLIDTSGAATAQVALWLWFWFHARRLPDAPDHATPRAHD
ncbi:MAG: VanZ family protein [Acidobacteriia bacterium]|nr:VanZ family protein [Terriglobia bacterium]